MSKGREEILQVHAAEKPLGDDVDLKRVAQTTAGFTGADLENLLNEAAILSAKDNRKFHQPGGHPRRLSRSGIGAEKKSKVISDKDEEDYRLIMKRAMESCSTCCRMRALSIPFPSFLQAWGGRLYHASAGEGPDV